MIKRTALLLLLALLLAGIVYAAGDITLQPNESVTVRCAGQHHAVFTRAGGAVTVYCAPNPVGPRLSHTLYFPAVAYDS